MATEIERKFLLLDERWRAQIERSSRMCQGYLVSDANRSVRVRISGEQAHLNIKSATVGASRSEYEYEIPLADADEMLHALCEQPLLEKTRHYLHHAGHLWEIDEFTGDNAGLVVAEIELTAADEAFAQPDWLGAEVTHERRYYNALLVKTPYKDW